MQIRIRSLSGSGTIAAEAYVSLEGDTPTAKAAAAGAARVAQAFAGFTDPTGWLLVELVHGVPTQSSAVAWATYARLEGTVAAAITSGAGWVEDMVDWVGPHYRHSL
jgi:hypothetical protein